MGCLALGIKQQRESCIHSTPIIVQCSQDRIVVQEQGVRFVVEDRWQQNTTNICWLPHKAMSNDLANARHSICSDQRRRCIVEDIELGLAWPCNIWKRFESKNWKTPETETLEAKQNNTLKPRNHVVAFQLGQPALARVSHGLDDFQRSARHNFLGPSENIDLKGVFTWSQQFWTNKSPSLRIKHSHWSRLGCLVALNAPGVTLMENSQIPLLQLPLIDTPGLSVIVHLSNGQLKLLCNQRILIQLQGWLELSCGPHRCPNSSNTQLIEDCSNASRTRRLKVLLAFLTKHKKVIMAKFSMRSSRHLGCPGLCISHPLSWQLSAAPFPQWYRPCKDSEGT